MSLLNQYRKELLAMATGDVDENTRRKLHHLIKTDSECRDYWDDISNLSKELRADAKAADKVIPSPFLHSKLRNAILNESRIEQSETALRSWNWERLWKIALAAPVAALSVWWVVSMVSIETTQSNPKGIANAPKPEPTKATFRAFIQAANHSPSSFDDLLRSVTPSSKSTKRTLVYRAFDGRTAELPSEESRLDSFKLF